MPGYVVQRADSSAAPPRGRDWAGPVSALSGPRSSRPARRPAQSQRSRRLRGSAVRWARGAPSRWGGGRAAGRGARRGAGTEGPGAQELSCIIAPPQFLSMRAPNVSMFAGQKCSPTSELFLPAPRHGAVRCDK